MTVQESAKEEDEPTSRRSTVLLVIGAALLSWSIMAGFDIRLATIVGDDTPLVYSHVFADGDAWKNDAISTHGKWAVWATAVNWVPALLNRYLGISARLTCWTMVYLQNFLMLIAVFRFSTVCIRDRKLSVLVSLFAFSAQLWGINLANYSAKMPMHWAIGSFFALPLIFFAMAAFLSGRQLAAALWFAVAAFVHPVLTLYCLLILGIFSLTSWRDESGRMFLSRMAGLLAIACLCIVPQLLNVLSLARERGIEASEFIQALGGIVGYGHACGPTFLPSLRWR